MGLKVQPHAGKVLSVNPLQCVRSDFCKGAAEGSLGALKGYALPVDNAERRVELIGLALFPPRRADPTAYDVRAALVR